MTKKESKEMLNHLIANISCSKWELDNLKISIETHKQTIATNNIFGIRFLKPEHLDELRNYIRRVEREA